MLSKNIFTNEIISTYVIIWGIKLKLSIALILNVICFQTYLKSKIGFERLVMKKKTMELKFFIKRPGVAEAVLQTPSS